MTQADPKTDTTALLRLICRALDEKKAGDVRVLRVGEISSITDFLVLATGTSDPHLRALRVELEKVIDATGTRILGMDTGTESGWLVIDAFDVMIHVLTPENRKRYAIEALWGDAEEIPLADVLNEKKSEALKPVKKSRKAKGDADVDKKQKTAKPRGKVGAKAPANAKTEESLRGGKKKTSKTSGAEKGGGRAGKVAAPKPSAKASKGAASLAASVLRKASAKRV